jgi:hypothetical protein
MTSLLTATSSNTLMRSWKKVRTLFVVTSSLFLRHALTEGVMMDIDWTNVRLGLILEP